MSRAGGTASLVMSILTGSFSLFSNVISGLSFSLGSQISSNLQMGKHYKFLHACNLRLAGLLLLDGVISEGEDLLEHFIGWLLSSEGSEWLDNVFNDLVEGPNTMFTIIFFSSSKIST